MYLIRYNIVMYMIKQTEIFSKWLLKLKDAKAKVAILRRIQRVQDGNFGDYKTISSEISELRITTGPGYRVYYTKRNEEIVILLIAGNKSTQTEDILKAKKIANANVNLLKDVITEDEPLVGIEPSCILSFRDEYPDLVVNSLKKSAKQLASRTLLFDEFVLREIKKGNILTSAFKDDKLKIYLHGHCHQKSLASVVIIEAA